MAFPRSAQEFIHWVEVGAGARGIRLVATLLGVAVLSFWISWRQFHGATHESTLIQADTGRQLAAGEGFTTLVNYPQVAAFAAKRGLPFDSRTPYPELYHAPLYPLVIAGALRVLPSTTRAALFTTPPVPPDGAPGDYVLLGLNLVLLWATVALVHLLARRLFDGRAAWLAALALLVSIGIWEQTLAITGAPLLMLLLVGAFVVWERVDRASSDDESGTESTTVSPRRTFGIRLAWLAALGGLCGLLFLTEYSAGALVLVALGYVAVRFSGSVRASGLVAVAVGFLFVVTPWVARNLALTGSPVALAIQNVALKAGDPTAEPAVQRNLLSADWPKIEIRKLGNKTLTTLQESVKRQIWSGGAMWFLAFFAAGTLYRFRSPVADRMRWTSVAALAVLLVAQAALNSGETTRPAAAWVAPVIVVFGAGFFFVLLGSNESLRNWPRVCAASLLLTQALPLIHDALEPRRLHFQYPPYFPGLFIGMRQELERRDHAGRFGIMADVPAGVAWYAYQRVWSQPAKLKDFYAITLEQPLGELLLTPRTLDRPFLSELGARPDQPGSLGRAADVFGEWGRIYAGLFTGKLPQEFPLGAPQKLSENLYVLLNPALPPPEK